MSDRTTDAWAEMDRAWRWCAATWAAWLVLGVIGGAVFRPLLVPAFACLALGMAQMFRYARRAHRKADQR